MRSLSGAIAKRLVDFVGASVGLLVFAPIIGLTAAAVRVKMGSPVMFHQVRPGLDRKLFTVIKFRTMRIDPDDSSDAARLNDFGRMLREWSLDELPQLWTVLRGEMSLVGPRPLIADYLPLYSPRQVRRFEMKPGLTSWNAVNGRNSITWEEQFEMDLWYVENQSFLLDLKILVMTVGKVISREGVTQEGTATRDRFVGGGA